MRGSRSRGGRDGRDRGGRDNRDSRRGAEPNRRQSVEVEAGSVDEAIIKALTELRVPKDRAAIEVLDEGKPKLLGLFGGRKSRVRATLKASMPGDRFRDRGDRPRSSDRPERPAGDRPVSERGPRPERADRGPRPERGERGGRDRDRERSARPDRPERQGRPERGDRPPRTERVERPESEERSGPSTPVETRVELVQERCAELLRLMGVDKPVTTQMKNGDLWLSVDSSDSDAILIGRRGETLTALEHLLTRMSSLHERDRLKVVMDVAGYRSRRGPARDSDAPEESQFDSGPADDEAEDEYVPTSRRPEEDDSEDTEPMEMPSARFDAEAAEAEVPVETGPPVNGGAHWPAAVDPEDEDTPDAGNPYRGGSGGSSRGPRGRDRDRGGRSGSGSGGSRDRDRRGGRSGGRDRDRGDYPPVEMTPEMEARMRESKRLEQEIIARAAVGPAVPEVAKDETPGPKLPSFRGPARPKRRGYRPPDAG